MLKPCKTLQEGVVLLVISKTILTLSMAMLQQAFKVEEENRKNSILEIISDKYCRGILNAVMDKPKSVMEITAETRIPVSTVYRRVQDLHDSKLLSTSGMISSDGKKFFLYKSRIKEIQTRYNNGSVDVEIVFNQH